MSRILVTGATGFVGRGVCKVLNAAGHDVIGTTRGNGPHAVAPSVTQHIISDQSCAASWKPVLNGVDFIIHLAARVHIMKESSENPLQAFRAANVTPTEALAREAANAGVKRIVFVSTIKVLGEGTTDRPFRHTDSVAPADPYAVSKSEAESVVRKIAAESELDFVILRPPMIYGPGVGGNLRRVFSLVHRGIPVPLGSIDNARNMLGLQNLCDVIELVLEHRNAAGETFLVADNEALSTPQLFRIVAKCMNQRPRLFPLPAYVLKSAGRLLGKSNEIDRLCGNLLVEIGHTESTLGWSPGVTTTEGLQIAVDYFLQQGRESSE